MKRILVTIIFIAITLVGLFLPIRYILMPGINNLKLSQEIKLSKQDVANKEKEINDKYIKLQKELDDKYTKLINEVTDKYSQMIKDLDKKYDTDLSHAATSNWYQDSVNKMNEESELKTKRNFEINDLNKQKNRESINLSKEKETELKNLNYINEDSTITLIKGAVFIAIGVFIDFMIIKYIITQFNNLIQSNNMVKESLANIDVMLKQRNDMIPNIVETVKGYAKHEEETLNSVIEARNNTLKSKDTNDLINTSADLNDKLNKLFVLVEKYPELKANKGYLELHKNLVDMEDKISIMRCEYNKCVLRYKNKVEMFPSSLVAIICNFKAEKFYEIDDKERQNVEINFS